MSSNSSSPLGWTNSSIDELKAEGKAAISIGPFGSRMKSDCYVESGIPVIRGTNLTGGREFEGEFVFVSEEKADELRGANVFKDDLVFPHRGAIGEVGIITEDKRYVLSTSLMKLTCDKKKADPMFLYYFFKSRIGRHELLKNASQVGTPGIGQPLNSLKNIRLNLPSVKKQNKIAEILSSLDDKIEINRQINQTLEHIAQAIFKSWFVDFEPVKAKIEAKHNSQDPERAAMRAISGKTDEQLDQLTPEQIKQLTATAALFPNELTDSELGPIPKGWNVSKIGNEFDVTMGQSPPGKTYNEVGEGMPFFQGRRDFGWRYPVNRIFCSVPKRLANAGDTLLSVRAPVGAVNKATSECCIGRGLAAIRHKSGFEAYTYYSVQRLEQLFNNFDSEGTVFGSINQKDLKSIKTINPNSGVLGLFVKIVGVIDEQIKILNQQSITLSSIRDSLLPKLLSGELTINEAQRTAEAVA